MNIFKKALIVALSVGLISVPTVTKEVEAAAMTGGEVLYLTPNSNWKVDNARFAIYVFGTGDAWESMTDDDGDSVYEVTVPIGNWTNVIFCRMNPNTTDNNWNNKWNQTSDLVYDGTKNHYTVAEGTWDKGGGEWSTFGVVEAPEYGFTTTTTYTVPESTSDTYYLNTGDAWKDASAWFAAYFFGSESAWKKMEDSNNDGIYEVSKPEGDWTNVIFCRMNPTYTELGWDTDTEDRVWNQTVDLTLPTNGNNSFVISNPWNESFEWKATGEWNFISYGHLSTRLQLEGDSEKGFSLRIVGVFGSTGGETYSTSDYEKVGFKLILGTKEKNVDVKYVYSSIIADSEEINASYLCGQYFFVATFNGLSQETFDLTYTAYAVKGNQYEYGVTAKTTFTYGEI